MNGVTILCYHKVGPGSEEGRRLNIEPDRLASHVRHLARRTPVLRVADLAHEWPGRGVAFTFDDAYESTLSYAPPLFERSGVRATFYAVTGRVGGRSDWDTPSDRPLASWDQLQAAAKAGHEIGNHTVSHPHLDRMGIRDQEDEIVLARRELDSRLGSPHSFCYPYGGVGDVSCVAGAGYAVAVSLAKGIATEHDPRLRLPRIAVAFGDALPLLLYRIHVRPKLRALGAVGGRSAGRP